MTTELTESVQIIRDAGGAPAFAVIPYAEYQALLVSAPHAQPTKPTIPNTVVNLAMDNDWSAARAWREHLGLTQSEVATRLGVSQSAYAQQEGKRTLRKSSREKIAAALGLVPEHLDF